jgi:hypothetical protein
MCSKGQKSLILWPGVCAGVGQWTSRGFSRHMGWAHLPAGVPKQAPAPGLLLGGATPNVRAGHVPGSNRRGRCKWVLQWRNAGHAHEHTLGRQ